MYVPGFPPEGQYENSSSVALEVLGETQRGHERVVVRLGDGEVGNVQADVTEHSRILPAWERHGRVPIAGHLSRRLEPC